MIINIVAINLASLSREMHCVTVRSATREAEAEN